MLGGDRSEVCGFNRVEHAHSTMNTRRAAMMRRDQAGSGGSWGQEGLGQVLGIPGAH